ncbi:IclR family transcriptional regulator [Cytobacillus sp. FSL W7-1323]|uniref:Glycerol operon regulatory protein n=1 Tax=Cytobacillus kochii TaxID=859143 RepID=A0A248TML6_9BACI|nr:MULTISPECIES: IclR family transcriptional regulator [Cytobacillus]ASV69447.1 IclR family transcriptional regulator [Cytobacillus kochii]MDQ0184206.1 DNA-binding IclR family transcriptional regulator [Cytobacillus kochii]MEA1852617.1 IclR family transcriptional regulator [Cytobacillus sp. OWB-43]
MERDNMVKSVSRALDIIDMISLRKYGMGVTEIANEMDINKSSVHRILSTLVKYGYIEQVKDSGKYKVGYKILNISTRLLDSIDIRSEAKLYLQDLEQKTNEVIHLVVPDNDEVVYIEKLDGNEALRMHSSVGKRAPMHCTSVGKAILAHQPVQVVKDIIQRKGLKPHTEHTITDEMALLENLKMIKTKGFALDLEENENGIVCIAVPIFDYQNNVCAAISVSGPLIRMSQERLQELAPFMVDIGKSVSIRLGYLDE